MATKPTASQPLRLKLSAAAARHDVHPDTLRRRIARGDLHAYRLGARIITVDVAELDELFRPVPTVDGAA